MKRNGIARGADVRGVETIRWECNEPEEGGRALAVKSFAAERSDFVAT